MDDAIEILVFHDETGAYYVLPRLVFEAARVRAEDLPELEAALRDEEVQGYEAYSRRRAESIGAASTPRSGAELSMIELQSLVAKRGALLQLTTGMTTALWESQKGIAGNIGR